MSQKLQQTSFSLYNHFYFSHQFFIIVKVIRPNNKNAKLYRKSKPNCPIPI